MKKPRKPADPYAHILPFPVGPIMLSPAMITAEGGVYRAALALSFAYWLSGCRPLPRDKSALASLIRLPQSRIGPMQSRLQATLAEILPILAAEYDAAFKSRAHRTAIAQLGQRAMVASRKAAKAHANDLQPISRPARISPVKAPPYRGDGRTDMQARKASIDRETASAATASPAIEGMKSLPLHAHRAAGLLSDSVTVRK
jgi:hypothetical protein